MAGSNEPSRVGFAWAEFGRRDETFTVGARIRASQSTARADVDFFTTTLAVGRGLDLLDETRTPLSRKSLIEAIGETGRVHDSAEAHRAAVQGGPLSRVRCRSLRVGHHRPAGTAQGEAVPEPRPGETVRRSFPTPCPRWTTTTWPPWPRASSGWTGARRSWLLWSRTCTEVRVLARHQRDYARAVLVGTSGEVRNAETRRDDVTRRERQAAEELAGAQERADELDEERRRLQERQDAIQVEVAALKDSDAYREGAALAELSIRAGQLREEAGRAAGRVQERADSLTVAVGEFRAAEEGRRTADANQAAGGSGPGRCRRGHGCPGGRGRSGIRRRSRRSRAAAARLGARPARTGGRGRAGPRRPRPDRDPPAVPGRPVRHGRSRGRGTSERAGRHRPATHPSQIGVRPVAGLLGCGLRAAPRRPVGEHLAPPAGGSGGGVRRRRRVSRRGPLGASRGPREAGRRTTGG